MASAEIHCHCHNFIVIRRECLKINIAIVSNMQSSALTPHYSPPLEPCAESGPNDRELQPDE